MVEVNPYAGNSIFWVEVDRINPNPYQPRKSFDETALASLAESIRQYGVLQPLTVTRREIEKPGEYQYRNGLSILAAAAISGGFTYRASRSKVYIKRASDEFEREYPIGPQTKVLPGDVIRVPERYF